MEDMGCHEVRGSSKKYGLGFLGLVGAGEVAKGL